MKKYMMAMVVCVAVMRVFAEENKLAEVLVDGEGWKLVSEGYGFADGMCSDDQGNVFFTDLKKGAVYKITAADGKVNPYIESGAGYSGMKCLADGKLICCGGKKVVTIDAEKKATVLAENVGTNDLIVSKSGNIYFTGNGKGNVTRIDPKGVVSIVAKDLGGPNGISLSPDQKTLVVSDYAGPNLFTLKLSDDGNVVEKAATFVLKLGEAKNGKAPNSGGDGMTTDAAGRYYVTTNVGIQVFAADGSALGVIEKPQNKGVVNVAFGGTDMKTLFVCNADKIYMRKMKATGMVFYK